MLPDKRKDPALEHMHSQTLGPFYTQLQVQPKKRIGHFDFSIFLKNPEGQRSSLPIVAGIHSKGNSVQHIFPWLDINYFDQVDFGGGNAITLSQSGTLAEDLFRQLGSILPSGSMIFLSYMTDISWPLESKLHEITRRSISVRSLGIPPAATPLGWLLFISGCRNIKSEAYDVQGSGRLAGEKSLNLSFEALFTRNLVMRIEQYWAKKPAAEFPDLEKVCRACAGRILNHLKNSSP